MDYEPLPAIARALAADVVNVIEASAWSVEYGRSKSPSGFYRAEDDC